MTHTGHAEEHTNTHGGVLKCISSPLGLWGVVVLTDEEEEVADEEEEVARPREAPQRSAPSFSLPLFSTYACVHL